mmetsp:Transcript_4399/g.7465  ORF Transcript_4399/g.7465 Transcript_4399/m.7465 type:complete len:150 (-) Transcript_4399:52-501(-)
MNALLSVPSSSVVDFIIEEFTSFYTAFLNLYSPELEQEVPNLDSQLHSYNRVQLACLPSSLDWLVDCLQTIPINIFTSDEKERLVAQMRKSLLKLQKKLVQCLNQGEQQPELCSRECEEVIAQELSSMRRVLKGELEIIFKRAKNHNKR